MWITAIIFIYLVVLGIQDYRKRAIPVYWLAVGGVLLSGIGIYKCVLGELWWTELLVAILPGVLLLLMAWLSGKAGYADGLVLMQLGLCLGCREGMLLFCFSMLLTSGVSIILLFLRKVRRDTKMPYLPFLAVAFLMRQF